MTLDFGMLNKPGRRPSQLLAVLGLLASGLAGVLPFPLAAQTVRPVIVEYVHKARGRFELVNDGLVPLNVVLEAKSFSLSEDGSPAFRPLDPGIHLKLSSMSFRIPPQQTYYVFYEATADHYPAWFTIYATFTGLPQQQGLNVVIDLPHTVYLLQKEPLDRTTVQVEKAEFVAGSRRVVVELQNASGRFGRVSEVEVRGGSRKASHPGFALLPNARRRLEISWEPSERPQRVLVHFPRFKIEVPLDASKN